MIDKDTRNRLFDAAWGALENAYAPYSHFKVGAAVLGEDGNIYVGCNIENISYGLTVCGERCALFNMVSSGCKKFSAMVCVTCANEVTTSCGACRQVMAEFAQSMDVPVIFAARCDEVLETTLGGLMPYYYLDAINDAK